MDGAAKFLTGTAKTLIFVYVVSLAGGTLFGIIYNAQPWQEALQQYSFLALLNVILYTVPLIILDIAAIHDIQN